MSKRNKYSPEKKAAVMAALLTGQRVDEVSDQFGVPATTIRAWKSKQNKGEDVVTVITEKKEEIGELLVDYLHDMVQTMRAQMKVFSDESYLKKQPADEAAVLHGVIADKGFRLLEALSGAEEEGSEE